jgi:hypothetical protein
MIKEYYELLAEIEAAQEKVRLNLKTQEFLLHEINKINTN